MSEGGIKKHIGQGLLSKDIFNMDSAPKFTQTDREMVIQELEKIQKSPLTPAKPSRKLFVDKNGKYYCIFGAATGWHGVSPELLNELKIRADKTLLVIAKKYRTRIDICVGTVNKLVEQRQKLKKTKQGGLQFHTILTEDGMYCLEIPELQLKKIGEIFLSADVSPSLDLSEIKKIVNLELLSGFTNLDPESGVTHQDIQAKIILIGKWLGYRTFTPDPSKESHYGKLGDLTSEKRMPTEYIAERLLDKVKQIDVIWFDDEGYPTHCFEVEHSTDITKGLLRMYQIRKLRIRMFIVSKETSKTKFEMEVNKDPFLHVKEQFVFRSYRELQEFFDSVKKFAIVRGTFLHEES
ncbi:MAG: hypothetical protein DCC52_00240 [Chloroflexi bacterium]|nr:MAG: hypothetical protein DCC52_00240 [Chloroflexota bacterium]